MSALQAPDFRFIEMSAVGNFSRISVFPPQPKVDFLIQEFSKGLLEQARRRNLTCAPLLLRVLLGPISGQTFRFETPLFPMGLLQHHTW
ncbi:MAG: hypothetical protein QNK42_08610 [Pseudodonghicola sp.]|nr:hypothetical protein [Pseudodonghicola sp.]